MRPIRLFTVVALLAALGAAESVAQEFLDTAGRWRSLSLPSGASPQIAPRAMVALRGHVVIGREGRSLLVSRDSGESWTNAGAALPAEAQTVWSLVHPDTTGTPARILGVAATGGTSARAMLIESTDGGSTWRDAGTLPELDALFRVPVDTMRLYGPPEMLFVDNSSGQGSTGFIYSAVGLLASTDGGASWSRRGTPRAFRAMSMHDELNGIAALGDHVPATVLSSLPGGIAWTSDGGETWTQTYGFSDGGFFQHITLKAFSATQYRAFVPERFQNYMDWRLLRSSDAGRSWGEYLGRQSRRPLYGRAFWRDTTDIHVVSDGAILQHAADGGELFYLLRDTTQGYWQTPLDLIPGYVTRAPIAATDGRYLYFTVPGNRAARWRMASIEPLAAIGSDATDAGMAIVPNPVDASGGRLLLGAKTTAAGELLIVDLIGRIHGRRSIEPGLTSIALPGALEPGAYIAILRQAGRNTLAPFVVAE